MEKLEKFEFNKSTIVIVQNVNSISKNDNTRNPTIIILYTSGAKEEIFYGVGKEIEREHDFRCFHK